jgi:hypothetical protein
MIAGSFLFDCSAPITSKRAGAGSGQRFLTIRYLVKHGGSEVTFNKPYEAWRYFQRLTGVPDRDWRPEPPRIDEAMRPRTGTRKLRRVRRRKPD